jgi:1-acyl-sn-glycerol-3-phosphate acyltransferase
MRKLGGIPVDRRAHQSLVMKVTEKFKSSEYLVLAVPPEGSRGKVAFWMSGFYHIASQSEVPIGLGYLDYDRNRMKRLAATRRGDIMLRHNTRHKTAGRSQDQP